MKNFLIILAISAICGFWYIINGSSTDNIASTIILAFFLCIAAFLRFDFNSMKEKDEKFMEQYKARAEKKANLEKQLKKAREDTKYKKSSTTRRQYEI